MTETVLEENQIEESANSAERRARRLAYIQNIVDKFSRGYYLTDLPENELKPGDPDYSRYLCRTNNWTVLSMCLEYGLDEHIFTDSEEQAMARPFLEQLKTMDFSKRRTAEDIDRAVSVFQTLQTALRRIAI